MNIPVAKQIIGSLGKRFDSHAFIFKLKNEHRDEYDRYLENSDVNAAHGRISNKLGDNHLILNIARDGDIESINTEGNLSECAVWRKIHNNTR